MLFSECILCGVEDYPDDLFKSTASYYAHYRPSYPDASFAFIRQQLRLDGTGTLLDLGCGTGQLLIPLSNDFQKVVGIDPEPEMLDYAMKEIKKQSIQNALLVKGSSRTLLQTCRDFDLFRAVTIGRAFYWMDQRQTLADLDSVTRPDGAVVIVNDGLGDKAEKKDWQIVVDTVKKKYLGERRRAGSVYFQSSETKFEDSFHLSAFNQIVEKTFSYQIYWNVDTILGYLYSTSYASPQVLGAKQVSFEAELRGKLHDLNPDDDFIEDVTLSVMIGKK